MTTRNYSSRSQQTTLTSAVTAGASTMVVVSGTALLGGVTIPAGTTFTIVVDPDTSIEEIVDATAVSTNTFTITRAIDGSSAQAHSAGAVVRHMAIGRDYREANTHIEASTGVHGISNSSSVVGTIDTQTLTNKTLTSPTITNPTISGTNVDASIVFEGATPDAFETTLTVTDPTQDNTITLPNTTGTVVIATAAQTLTNKTMGDALNAGGFKITNLATPTLASDAVRKDFADAQVAAAATSATSAAASATAAASSATTAAASVATIAGYASAAATSATSASASATAAATSAASASTSAGSSETSAIASATSASASASSATAAATSATSAAAYATAAATSATSAAASATAAATSATSAAASATTAANSVATIAGYATSAANSATASATSATSAAASATAASTSAASAATSATSAATTYDEFDDRYLGSKSTAPTVDNDGNPLLVGAIYWNSTVNNMYVWSGSTWVQIATTTIYTAPTLGTTTLTSGTTVSSVSALTLNNATITGTLTAGASSGTNGQVLQSTGTGTQWSTPAAGYSAPTLGTTSIASGATVTNINGLTINSTTIPTSKTLVATDTTDFVKTAGGSTITVASGTTVPLTIQNNGTGNSFVVNDVASDTSPFVIDADGRVGIGTSSPVGSLSIKAVDATATGQVNINKYIGTAASPTESLDWPEPILNLRGYGNFTSESMLSFGYSNDATYQTGEAVWNFRLVGVASAITSSSSTNLSLAGPGALVLGAGSAERMRIDSTGNVFIGTNVTAGQNTGGLTIQGKDIELMNIMGAY